MYVSSQTPSPPTPHLYSQQLRLKLYQAFIFSIPILFSIILFLLFYLFYLKRRVSTLSSPPPPLLLTTSSNISTTSDMALKGELKGNLVVVLFDEELGAKDSQCCVCLGEFEMEEELHQMPFCKHVFHMDCITDWLLHHSNSTCPLCRASVFINSSIS